jgi:hypothetical protein
MRFATYVVDGTESAGVVDGSAIRPLPAGQTVLGLIQRGREAMLGACARALAAGPPPVPLAGVRLLPPIHPPSIRDFVGFEAHVEGVSRAQEGRSEVDPAISNTVTEAGAVPPIPAARTRARGPRH